MSRAWLRRVAGGALASAAGYGVTALMDFDPRPIGWVLLSLLALSLMWLVLDTVDTARSRWLPTLPRPTDRFEEIDRDRRLLDSHAAKDHPSPALRDRLVALARTRDPALTDPELADLATSEPRRLTPTDIDHYLTRIEALRDRS